MLWLANSNSTIAHRLYEFSLSTHYCNLQGRCSMAWPETRYAIVLLVLLLPPPCVRVQQMTGSSPASRCPLSPGATIVSDGGSFALGFFSRTNSTPGRRPNCTSAARHMVQRVNDISRLAVVWVANRETPVTNSSSSTFSSPPVLSRTNASKSPTLPCPVLTAVFFGRPASLVQPRRPAAAPRRQCF